MTNSASNVGHGSVERELGRLEGTIQVFMESQTAAQRELMVKIKDTQEAINLRLSGHEERLEELERHRKGVDFVITKVSVAVGTIGFILWALKEYAFALLPFLKGS